MGDAREVLARALAEQAQGDEDELRDWLTDRADFVEDALAGDGVFLVSEGQAVIGGEVVELVRPDSVFEVFTAGDGERSMRGRTDLYAARPLSDEEVLISHGNAS